MIQNIGVKFNFKKGDYEEGKLVKAADTCKKLFEIIQNNTFGSGTSIDYYDKNI